MYPNVEHKFLALSGVHFRIWSTCSVVSLFCWVPSINRSKWRVFLTRSLSLCVRLRWCRNRINADPTKESSWYPRVWFLCRRFVMVRVVLLYMPPLNARTRWRVLPPSSPYSAAVLSSALGFDISLGSSRILQFFLLGKWPGLVIVLGNIHLLSSINESLLNRWNAFFLFNSFFYPWYLIVGLDV